IMNQKQEKNLTEAIQTLTELVEKLRDERYLQIIDDKKKFLWYNFLTGAAKGLGFMIGSTVVLALTIWLLYNLVGVPVLGEWVADFLNFIEKARLR
ncbi:MAG: DUF5665 domain-containing protein, partial [Candidatus Paceibacterota bacterium]